MLLQDFIHDLWQQGSVSVANDIGEFSEEDESIAHQNLLRYYANDALHLSGKAPAFQGKAAMWAARFLYRAIQLTLLRDKGAETVNEQLSPFPDEIDAGTVYSVDLCFRYLPHLLHLAKGLAPGDVLVTHLLQTAAQWPFSSVGMPVEVESDLQVILANDCLRQTYIDRIIEKRDVKRAAHALVNERVLESLGNYRNELWPGFEPLTIEK